jgi:hypothetical protein
LSSPPRRHSSRSHRQSSAASDTARRIRLQRKGWSISDDRDREGVLAVGDLVFLEPMWLRNGLPGVGCRTAIGLESHALSSVAPHPCSSRFDSRRHSVRMCSISRIKPVHRFAEPRSALLERRLHLFPAPPLTLSENQQAYLRRPMTAFKGTGSHIEIFRLLHRSDHQNRSN